jgi:hypothetical protein
MTNGAQAAHPVVRWDGHAQSVWLRRKLEEAGLLSMAEVPATLHVSRAEPEVGVPPPPLGGGAYPTTLRVVAEQPLEMRQVAERKDTERRRVAVTNIERGVLEDTFAARPEWNDVHEREGAGRHRAAGA